MGIRSVRRGIRKWRAKAPQGEGKGPKKFLKKCIFEKLERKECFANTYVVSRCGRGVWYIVLRNVGKIEQQQQVVSTPPL